MNLGLTFSKKTTIDDLREEKRKDLDNYHELTGHESALEQRSGRKFPSTPLHEKNEGSKFLLESIKIS